MSKKPFIVGTVALVASLIAGPAFAATMSVENMERSVVVSYADLDLASQTDMATLLARIEAAAKDVCAPAPSPKELVQSQAYGTCLTRAVGSAVAGSGIPQLAKAYAANTSAGDLEVAAR